MNQREEFRNRRAVVAFSWFDTCLGMEGVWVGAPSNGHFTHPAVLLYNCQGKTEKLFYLQCRHGRLGVGNGTPLQCSCLENPTDGGAWFAAVYGVAQSRTQLKRLSSSSRHGGLSAVLCSIIIVVGTIYCKA